MPRVVLMMSRAFPCSSRPPVDSCGPLRAGVPLRAPSFWCTPTSAPFRGSRGVKGSLRGTLGHDLGATFGHDYGCSASPFPSGRCARAPGVPACKAAGVHLRPPVFVRRRHDKGPEPAEICGFGPPTWPYGENSGHLSQKSQSSSSVSTALPIT